MTLRFHCPMGEEPPAVAEEVVRSLGLAEPEAFHYSPRAIAAAVEQTRQARGSRIWRLPLCHTLEAEALGARPVLSFSGARIKAPPYSQISELPEAMDLSGARLAAIWEAMEQLREREPEGHIAFDLTGPFSVLSGLVPLARLYKAARGAHGAELFAWVETQLAGYAEQAYRRGAEMFSLADPVATMDLLGEAMFRQCYVPVLFRLLERLHRGCPKAIIHICGKLSQGLLDTGQCTAEWQEATGEHTYEALLLRSMAGADFPMIVGQGCLHQLQKPWGGLCLLRPVQG